MRPNDTEPSCDAAPPFGTKWQRVCACTPYFLARKEQSCQAACEEGGSSCNLEKVTLMKQIVILFNELLSPSILIADQRGCNECPHMQKHHWFYGLWGKHPLWRKWGICWWWLHIPDTKQRVPGYERDRLGPNMWSIPSSRIRLATSVRLYTVGQSQTVKFSQPYGDNMQNKYEWKHDMSL